MTRLWLTRLPSSSSPARIRTMRHRPTSSDSTRSLHRRITPAQTPTPAGYFGQEIALYFAWIGFLAYYMAIPTLFGLGCQLYYLVHGYTWCDDSFDWVQVSVSQSR